ncbi:MAG: hydroxyisourate hydrolase [Micromonosporaceae bacterium]|nr:hydroxyisourate hydrolase [Micromonosporaceae bacterium]
MSLSTHVLDASVGRPAAGVAVCLERRDGGDWSPADEGRTDADGRLKGLSAGAAGDYRLLFGTGDYFAQRGVEAFHPEVVVAFRITDPAEHHHVPLLLSPYSYTTYRGS